MTTPYIDPQFIFASDAPTQDKPPAFNNYVKGMDETRSNDGRPTIKQFNFLQQQNDLKFLYIHERGACLPFVDGFPYENNAIVFKDGLIQQKNGASWVIPFMRGSQNLAELTDVAQARTKLDVYSKGESLAKANNLSELTDKAVARTNLGVYSKAETDSIAGTPNATEVIAGKAKIATTAIAQAGVNDTDFITPQKFAQFASGFKQTLVNVTASRFLGSTYTNTSGKTRLIRALSNKATNTSLNFKVTIGTSVFQTPVSSTGATAQAFLDFYPVPPGETYKIENGDAGGAVTSFLSFWEYS